MYFLGCKEKREDSRTLRFAHYAGVESGSLPPAPQGFAWSKGVQSWGAMLNDREGDCTCAAIGHMIQAWTLAVAGAMLTLTDEAVQAAYVAVTGEEGAAYDPATRANDNGCNILDVLNYWRQVGVGGHKIMAYVAIDHTNRGQVLLAGELFGGLYCGVNLPLTARDQLDAGQTWDVPAGGAVGRGRPRSWGGHAVLVVDANATGPVCVTWGKLRQMTWDFWFTYFSEAYAVLAPEWIDAAGVGGSGFDLATLQADLSAVTGEPIPTPKPIPTPPKPPTLAALILAADDSVCGQLAQMFAGSHQAVAALASALRALKTKHQQILAA